MLGSLCLLVLVQLWLCHGAIDTDLITSLPGLSPMPPYRQYSGYLKATGGRMLHYWFLESQNSPKTDPVVVWMNGGPGCSSLDGLLEEHGPFLVEDDGVTLKDNPYSWNKIANMLYLEAPAGVGFSYKDDKNYTTSDDQTAIDNHAALQYFLIHYREFAKNEFYVTGESYGGIYVPTLSSLLVDDPDFNFKGYAVGNGLSDRLMNANSLLYFGYYHGLFGDKIWNDMMQYCCNRNDESRCDFAKSQDLDCQYAVNSASSVFGELNIYNLYARCYYGNNSQHTNPAFHPLHQTFRQNIYIKQKYMKIMSLPRESLKDVPPCIDATGVTRYLNRAEVRKALHIPAALPEWAICSGEVGERYQSTYSSVRSQYLKVLNTEKHRILVYNGDVDMACNFLGDQWFVDSLDQEIIKGYSSWHYKDTDGSQQLAGFAKQFKNINFVTVKGAGHMVPQDKPQQAFIMFKNFLQDLPFQ